MNRDDFEKEFSTLKPYDKVDYSSVRDGELTIHTMGHGYLVILKNSQYGSLAEYCASGYSYEGKTAWYLEEDCDASKYHKLIGVLTEEI